MKRIKISGLVTLGCLMFTASAFAQQAGTTSSFEALRNSLKLRPGERIEITDASGNKIAAKLDGISGSILTAHAGKSALEFRESSIAEIRHRKPERWWDGMVIGMGAGAATGLATAMSFCENDSECAFYATVAFVPTFTGAGAGVGALID